MSLPPTPQELDEEQKETELIRLGSFSRPSGETLLVGSARDCDVTIKDISISPQHLSITKLEDPGHYRVTDLKSASGTWYKGNRITDAVVQKKDVLQLGSRPVEVRWIATHFSGSHLVNKPEITNATLSSSLIIGCQAPADILIQFPDIDDNHAEIRLDTDGSLYITDRNSSKGTFINHEPVLGWTCFTRSDTIHLGSYRVLPVHLDDWIEQLNMLAALFDFSGDATETELAHDETETIDFSELNSSSIRNTFKQIEIPLNGTLSIGRSPDCDVILDHSSVSWNHAELRIISGEWQLIDLSSSNGTFVDGSQISKSIVHASSWIRIGAVVLQLKDGLVSAPHLKQGELRLDAIGLCKTLNNGQTLLDDISLSIYPGEIIALMGPSGAGKSVLIECLTGNRLPTSGSLTLNGRDLNNNWEEFRHNIGYVPQDDVIHRDLTVYEVLYYGAKIRLPRDIPEEKVRETVERLLTRMGLAHIKHSIIGDEKNRGISGGQRKRVNIALELLTEPHLLFLDEPTSGLDATSTLEVLNILRTLADSGKTVVMTIHQPRVEAYKLIDLLLMMGKGGKLVYFGPAHPDATQYFGEAAEQPFQEGNPADYIMDVLENPVSGKLTDSEQWRQRFVESTYHKRFVVGRLSQRDTTELDIDGEIAKRSAPFQVFQLFSRYTQRKLRDKGSLTIQLMQAPVIAFILGMLFWQEGYAMKIQKPITAIRHEGILNLLQLNNGIHATLFLISAAAFWFGCSNVAREIVSERAIFLRELRTGLRPIAYLSSIFMYQFLLAAVQTFLLATIVWISVGLTAPLLTGWFLLLLVATCGIALGLCVSTFSESEVSAISVIPLLLLPQLMLGGFIKLYGLLAEETPQDLLADLMPIRWAFEMITVLEYQSLVIINPPVDGRAAVRSLDNVIGFTQTTFSTPVTILLAFTSVFVGLTLIQLNRVSKSDDFRDDQRDTIAKIGVVMIVVISVLLGAYIGEPEPRSAQPAIEMEAPAKEKETINAADSPETQHPQAPAQEEDVPEDPIDAETINAVEPAEQ